MKMRKWKITYIDTKSNGQKRTTYYTGDCTVEFLIDFFGLEEPDVLWYEIELDSD